MLSVNLFGVGQARYFDRPLPGFPTQQPCLLLCHLLINRTYPHNREHLAAVFWGDMPSLAARKSLRNSLWRLRQIFQSVGAPPDEFLFITEESISFINQSNHRLDVEIFEKTLHSFQDIPARSLSPDQAFALEEAAKIYIGDLLGSVYEDWVLYERERLRILYLSALNKLMIYHGIKGNYDRGLTYGEQILAHDNTREKVHRQMMWLYYLQGDRNAALAQFKRCRQILREELGVQPMDETGQLYEQMLHNQFCPKGWPEESEQAFHVASAQDHTLRTMVEESLQKLNALQAINDQTSAELRLLERLFKETLSRMGET